MSNIVDINKNKRHWVFSAMCRTCMYAWVAVVPKDTNIFKLECKHCGDFNSFASYIPSDFLGLPSGHK